MYLNVPLVEELAGDLLSDHPLYLPRFSDGREVTAGYHHRAEQHSVVSIVPVSVRVFHQLLEKGLMPGKSKSVDTAV